MFFSGRWMISLSLTQTRVGSSNTNITWIVHLTDLHLSKHHNRQAHERTEQLQQLGKSKIKWGARAVYVFPFSGENQ